tara:strand:+ start:230 stop:622 length:393 start_codon:yes stop_codon:yes gene_type:complete
MKLLQLAWFLVFFLLGCSVKVRNCPESDDENVESSFQRDRFVPGATLNNLFQDSKESLDGIVCDTVLGGTSALNKSSFSVYIKSSEEWMTIFYEPRHLVTGDQMIQIMKGEFSNPIPSLTIIKVLPKTAF